MLVRSGFNLLNLFLGLPQVEVDRPLVPRRGNLPSVGPRALVRRRQQLSQEASEADEVSRDWSVDDERKRSSKHL